MNHLYSYYDYEEAYYHLQWYKCKEVGCYLLLLLKDKYAKKLYKQLVKLNWAWDLPQKEQERIAKLLLDVKIWLMVNQNVY